MRLVFAVAGMVAMVTPALAQTAATTSGSGAFAPGSSGGSPVKNLLVDGYEVKTGFSDNSGGAYLVLQKATSAYMCHSSPNQTCEKLN